MAVGRRGGGGADRLQAHERDLPGAAFAGRAGTRLDGLLDDRVPSPHASQRPAHFGVTAPQA